MEAKNINVNYEIGELERVIVHTPDIGIGKIIPSKYEDWLYDDTVQLSRMQKEHDDFVQLLLYFLDKEKIENLKSQKEKYGNQFKRLPFFKPYKKEYFNSDKVLDVQKLLAQLLEKNNADDSPNIVRIKIISAICALEGCSTEIENILEELTASDLAKTLISGILPKGYGDENNMIFPPLPNLLFTRDIGIVVNDHLLLSKPAKKARRRESLLTKFIALNLFFKDDKEKLIEITDESDFFLIEEKYREEKIITIEGGDVMMISPNHLIVGCSERTSPNGVNAIIHNIFSRESLNIEKISVVKIPKVRAQMHIDTIFTQVKRNMWVLFGHFSEIVLKEEDDLNKSYLESLLHKKSQMAQETTEILQFYKAKTEKFDPSKSYMLKNSPAGLEGLLRQVSIEDFACKPEDVKIIYSGGNRFPHDEREQWTDSCNVVALKEGVVVGYDRNEKTILEFENNGVKAVHVSDLLEQFENGLDPKSVEDTLILLSSYELSRARGGSHCMTMPLLRKDI